MFTAEISGNSGEYDVCIIVMASVYTACIHLIHIIINTHYFCRAAIHLYGCMTTVLQYIKYG